MKPLALLLLLAAVAGCSKPPAPTVEFQNSDGKCLSDQPDAHGNAVLEDCLNSPYHEAQVYAELWRICAEKHLSYRVATVQGLGTAGYAWDNKLDFLHGVAGKGPYWETSVNQANDTTKVAEELIKLLAGPPTNKGQDSVFDTGTVRP